MERKSNLKNEELEPICLNCDHFFPASMGEPTEFGICLKDEVFEPYLDELIENSNYAPCQDLINQKKFSGEKEACAYFEEIEVVESIEIDDNSQLGRELLQLSKTGRLNSESFKTALIKEQIRNIDWKTVPVHQYVKQLKDPNPAEQLNAISSLAGLIGFGNMEAFKELFNFFKELPPPGTIEEVHFKKEVLRHLRSSKTKTILIPQLIYELYHTPSNNTTRQYINDIFQFLKFAPREDVLEPLEKMLEDKKFSYRIKRKIKDILNH